MKPRFILAATLAFISVFAPLLGTTVHSQASNPLWLREMPSEERILREVKSADAIDSAARQYGAFEQLNRIIRAYTLADFRDENHLTPDETRISAYYAAASTRALQRLQAAVGQDQQRLLKLQGYATNADFTSELLNQFFSPKFRSLYPRAKLALEASEKRKANSNVANFLEGVEYLCNGERVWATCDPDNKSDSGHCDETYPDRRNPRGFQVVQSTTRGEVQKLYATCQPPSAQAIEEHRRVQEAEERIEAEQRRAPEEWKRYVEQLNEKVLHAASDPGTLALRRCAAAGREPWQCVGEVFTSEMKTMAGGDAGMGSFFGKTLPTGLRMTGLYGDSHFGLSFTEDTLWVTCNQSSYQTDYTVTSKNGEIAIAVSPGREASLLGNKPFVLSLDSNGSLAGSGELQVSSSVVSPGQTATKPQTETLTRRRYMSEAEARQARAAGGLLELPKQEPTTGAWYVDETYSTTTQPRQMHTTKTSRCMLGSVRPLGSTGPTYGTQSLALMTGSKTSEIFGSAPYEQRSAKEKAWPGPGLRLYGTFAGQGGFSLEFHEDSVIVSCGQALSAGKYTIRYGNGQEIVSVENGTNPFTMVIGPGLTLSGSGSVRINGHAFVGDRNNGHGPMYAPASATCTLGTLNPAR